MHKMTAGQHINHHAIGRYTTNPDRLYVRKKRVLSLTEAVLYICRILKSWNLELLPIQYQISLSKALSVISQVETVGPPVAPRKN